MWEKIHSDYPFEKTYENSYSLKVFTYKIWESFSCNNNDYYYYYYLHSNNLIIVNYIYSLVIFWTGLKAARK